MDSPERQADWRRAKRLADAGLKQIRVLIQENRLRIQTLSAQGVNKENLSKLEACYKTSADAAQEYGVELDAVYDYASFLKNQNDYPRAIKLCEWMEAEYRQTDAPPETRARLWNLLGICRFWSQDFEESENYFRNALKSYLDLSKDNPAVFRPYVARSRNNLAFLLMKSKRYEEAETLYREALETHRALHVSPRS